MADKKYHYFVVTENERHKLSEPVEVPETAMAESFRTTMDGMVADIMYPVSTVYILKKEVPT
jgi:hypothetical protein